MRRIVFLPAVLILLAVPFAVSLLSSARDNETVAVPISSPPAQEEILNLPSPSEPLVRFNAEPEVKGGVVTVNPKEAVRSFREQIDKVIQNSKESPRGTRDAAPLFGSEEGKDGFPSTRSVSRPFTEEEAFLEVWPESYRREVLGEVQKAMHLTGFLKEGESYAFNSLTDESAMYEFMKRIGDFGYSLGALTPEQVAHFKAGVDKLRELAGAEKQNLMFRGTRAGLYLTPVDKLLAQNGFMRGLAEQIREFFLVRVANAIWVSSPGGECYKFLGVLPSLGPNSPAECCNCGLHIDEGVPIFVPECGPGGRGPCDIPLGCLNLNCGKYPEAIWDGPAGFPPPTFICGCG